MVNICVLWVATGSRDEAQEGTLSYLRWEPQSLGPHLSVRRVGSTLKYHLPGPFGQLYFEKPHAGPWLHGESNLGRDHLPGFPKPLQGP